MDFVEALNMRMQDVASMCVGCGKCFEVCPMKGPIGLSEADPKEVLGGIVDLIRGGNCNKAAERWAGACSSSGLCRDACDYGVDPLFLVKMANYANIRLRDGDAVRKERSLLLPRRRKVAADGVQASAGSERDCSVAAGIQVRQGRMQARHRLLYWLQRGKDTAYRSAGCRDAPGDGLLLRDQRRSERLLRHQPISGG